MRAFTSFVRSLFSSSGCQMAWIQFLLSCTLKKNLSFLLKRTELLIKDQNNNNTYIEVQSIDI